MLLYWIHCCDVLGYLILPFVSHLPFASQFCNPQLYINIFFSLDLGYITTYSLVSAIVAWFGNNRSMVTWGLGCCSILVNDL